MRQQNRAKRKTGRQSFVLLFKNADTDAFYRKRTPFLVLTEGFQAGAAFAHIIGSIFLEVSTEINNTIRVNNAEAETGSGYSGKEKKKERRRKNFGA